MQRSSRIAVAGGAVAAALALAAAAIAAFSTSASASQTLSTALLAPPTAVSPTQVTCKNNKPPDISISWTASTSPAVASYNVYRSPTSGSGYTLVGTVAAPTTTFADPSTTLAYSTTYYYVVDAAVQSWTARSAVGSVTTLSRLCK